MENLHPLWIKTVRTATEPTETLQGGPFLLGVDQQQAGSESLGGQPAMGRAEKYSQREGETHCNEHPRIEHLCFAPRRWSLLPLFPAKDVQSVVVTTNASAAGSVAALFCLRAGLHRLLAMYPVMCSPQT